MNRGKGDDSGIGAAFQMIHKKAVGFVGIGNVAVFYLFGKTVERQPVEQLQIHSHAADRVLRGVRVQVNQTGDNEFAPVIGNRQGGVLIRQAGKDPGGFSFITDQKGVGHGFENAGAFAPADIALYGKRVHAPGLLRTDNAEAKVYAAIKGVVVMTVCNIAIVDRV